MIEIHLHWLFLTLFVLFLATYLILLYRKDHNKRKLIFSIGLYIASIAYIGLCFGFITSKTENTSVFWHNIYIFSTMPLLYSIFIATNETFLKIKNINKTFNIFLLLTIVTLILIFLPFKITVINSIIMQILSIEIIVAVLYYTYKTKAIDNIPFFLYIICGMIGGLSLSYGNDSIAVFAFVFSFVFLTLLFIKERFDSQKTSSVVGTYFSIEQKLKTSEDKFKQLFNNIPDAICLLSEDGEILEVNKQMANNFNTSAEEIIGKNMHEILPKDIDNERTDFALKAFKTGKIQENEDKRNNMCFHNIFIPIETESKQKNLMVIARDVTLEKQMTIEKEEKLHDLRNTEIATLNIMEDMQETMQNLNEARGEISDKNEELKMSNQELLIIREQISDLNKDLEAKVQQRTAEIEQLLKQKDDFINQLGHDLKTPITPLNTLLPIVRKRVKDPNVSELLDVSIQNVNYMKNLIAKTMTLARLNAPSTTFKFEDTNLLEELNKILSSNQFTFKENDIQIENMVDEKINVKADKLRLDELFDNLISNAIKYTKGGGKIIIDAKKDKENIKVTIKDTGVGITEKQMQNIFKEFYKADESRHDFHSSGLGLSICKRIVEKHGGKIWAESPGKEKGSTFYFIIKSSDGKNN